MTALATGPAETVTEASAPESAPAPFAPEQASAPGPVPPVPRGRLASTVLQISTALSLLLLLVVGFLGYAYGLSGLSEERAQQNLLKSFTRSLGQAVAPIGPTVEGNPVAVLDIPAIGLSRVVIVEGTSGRDLTRGPGHRADTVLPGQTGVSVVFGRRVMFGRPFEHLLGLDVGDIITATTGQGVARYRVSSFGDEKHPAPANSANRLILITADSVGYARSFVSVSADLITRPQASPGNLPLVPKDQAPFTKSTDTLLPTLLWSQALLILAIGATIAAQRWSRTATYLAAVPMAFAVLWNLYENAAGLLPNLY